MTFRIVAVAAGLGSLAMVHAQPAAAIGCVTGGLAGAIAGHAVHHGVMGAVGGCVAGHYAHKHQQAAAANKAEESHTTQTGTVAQPTPSQSGAAAQPAPPETSHSDTGHTE